MKLKETIFSLLLLLSFYFIPGITHAANAEMLETSNVTDEEESIEIAPESETILEIDEEADNIIEIEEVIEVETEEETNDREEIESVDKETHDNSEQELIEDNENKDSEEVISDQEDSSNISTVESDSSETNVTIPNIIDTTEQVRNKDDFDKIFDNSINENESVKHKSDNEVNKREDIEPEISNNVQGQRFQATSFTMTKSSSPKFKNGDKDKRVVQLKKDMMKLGFGGMKVTETYGSLTEKRMKELQKYYGLKVTGEADKNTLDRINKEINTLFQKGNKSAKIKQLKLDMMQLGFTNFKNPNNNFGSSTEKYLKELQKYYSLRVNGLGDSVTLNYIKDTLNSKYQNGYKGSYVKNLKLDLRKLGIGNFSSNPNVTFGPITEKRVKEFQKYFGLKVNGIADDVTLKALKRNVNTVHQLGKSSNKNKIIKKNLNKLGFNGIKVTNKYGTFTEKRVKEFQKYFGLKVNGIIDDVTYNVLNKNANTVHQLDKKSSKNKNLKEKMLRLGFKGMKVTNTYGSFTEKKMKELQKYYGLKVNGIADDTTIAHIDKTLKTVHQLGKNSSKNKKVKEKLNALGFGKIKVTNLYGDFSDKKMREFQKAHKLVVNGMGDSVTLNKLDQEYKKSLTVKPPENYPKLKLFLDPGHGGHDGGAGANGLREKDLTLSISSAISNYLNKTFLGVDIRMSRTDDRYVGLEERARLANNWGADYFLSVHINAGGGTGFESYVHNGHRGTAQAKANQKTIHEHVAKNLDVRDRGMKSANFSVLRNTKMSAVLMEYLFIDNANDAAKLKTTSYINKMAKATAEGIAKAFNLVRK